MSQQVPNALTQEGASKIAQQQVLEDGELSSNTQNDPPNEGNQQDSLWQKDNLGETKPHNPMFPNVKPFFQQNFGGQELPTTKKAFSGLLQQQLNTNGAIQEESNENTHEQQQRTPTNRYRPYNEDDNHSMQSNSSLGGDKQLIRSSIQSNVLNSRGHNSTVVFDYSNPHINYNGSNYTKKRKYNQTLLDSDQDLSANEEIKNQSQPGYFYLTSRDNHSSRGNQQQLAQSQRAPVQEDNMIVDQYRNADGVLIKKVRTNQLKQLMKSKQEIYSILATQGQYYLPSYADCTVEFLKQIFVGKKKVLLNSEVKMVNVPKMNELSAKRLVGDVEGDELICQYLPDLSGGKYINRQYMFNIINTLRPHFFEQSIKQGLKERQDQAALNQKKFVEMTEDLYNLVTNAVNLNINQRGKAISLMNAGSKPRTMQQKPQQRTLKKRISDYPTSFELEQQQLEQFEREMISSSNRRSNKDTEQLRSRQSGFSNNQTVVSQNQPQFPNQSHGRSNLTEKKRK